MAGKARFECDVCGADHETFRCGAKGCVLMACLDCLNRHESECIERNGARGRKQRRRGK